MKALKQKIKMKMSWTNPLEILSFLGVITKGRKYHTRLGVGVKMRLAQGQAISLGKRKILQSTIVEQTQNHLSFGRKTKSFLNMKNPQLYQRKEQRSLSLSENQAQLSTHTVSLKTSSLKILCLNLMNTAFQVILALVMKKKFQGCLLVGREG